MMALRFPVDSQTGLSVTDGLFYSFDSALTTQSTQEQQCALLGVKI